MTLLLQTCTWKVAPALACGNTFVYKPRFRTFVNLYQALQTFALLAFDECIVPMEIYCCIVWINIGL